MAIAEEVIREYAELNVDQIVAAVESDSFVGFCVLCGEEAYGVEPDAAGYPCSSCHGLGVYGAEELIFYGVA